jgi:hypothetical protein
VVLGNQRSSTGDRACGSTWALQDPAEREKTPGSPGGLFIDTVVQCSTEQQARLQIDVGACQILNDYLTVVGTARVLVDADVG